MNLQLVTAYYVPNNRKIDQRLMRVVVDMEKFISAFPTNDGCIELVFEDHNTVTVRKGDYVALMRELGINGNKFCPEVLNIWSNKV